MTVATGKYDIWRHTTAQSHEAVLRGNFSFLKTLSVIHVTTSNEMFKIHDLHRLSHYFQILRIYPIIILQYFGFQDSRTPIDSRWRSTNRTSSDKLMNLLISCLLRSNHFPYVFCNYSRTYHLHSVPNTLIWNIFLFIGWIGFYTRIRNNNNTVRVVCKSSKLYILAKF